MRGLGDEERAGGAIPAVRSQVSGGACFPQGDTVLFTPFTSTSPVILVVNICSLQIVVCIRHGSIYTGYAHFGPA